jgi:hypothetical protein
VHMNDKNKRVGAFLRALFSQFDTAEVLFLFGLAAFFYGISQVISIPAAFSTCGVILMLIAVAMSILSRPKGE